MKSNDEELESLLIEWEAETLNEEGLLRIREILRDDPDARKYFVQTQMLTAALKMEGDAGIRPLSSETEATQPVLASRHPASETSPSRSRVSSGYLWFAAAAAAIACVLGARLAYVELGRPASVTGGTTKTAALAGRRDAKEAMSSGIALVTSLVDVVWTDEQRSHEVGDALGPGAFAIDSGLAQIEFFCGASVIVEGPAELDLKSAMFATVHRGRLRAQVPPAARGFSLDVAEMTVVDLGTEFGVSVFDGKTDVQVFDGEVELRQPAEKTRSLIAGQAVVRDPAGSLTDAPSTPSEFVDINTMKSRDVQQRMSHFERWKSWSASFRHDPRLIAYFAFENDGDQQRKLLSSLQPTNAELDGAIVGAQRVDGRWSQKESLEFKKPGDRVRVQIPGEYSSLTFACWVKIDSLDRWYNSLFLTDGYEKGEPHWQILDTGQLFFSMRPRSDRERGPGHHVVLSPAFWNPSLSGKWLHLATTYDASDGTVTHFLDGEVMHRETIPEQQRVTTTRFGLSTIGNWTQPQSPEADFAIRNLNGRMDELMILSGAMSAKEVKEVYLNGKP